MTEEEFSIIVQKVHNNDSSLKRVGFSDKDINDTMVTRLAQALEENTVVTSLRLYRNPEVGDAAATALANLLRKNPTLNEIIMYNCSVSDDGARELLAALEINETVTILGLDRNKVSVPLRQEINKLLERNLNKKGELPTPFGFESVLSALEENSPTFFSIELDDCGGHYLEIEYGLVSPRLVPLHVCKLAAVLKSNTVAKELHIHGVGVVGDKGAGALAEVIQENTTLVVFSVTNSQIGDLGVCALADALKGNRTLRSLDLSGNLIGKEGGQALLDMLEHNKTLTSVYFDKNEINQDLQQKIYDLLTERSRQRDAAPSAMLNQNQASLFSARRVADEKMSPLDCPITGERFRDPVLVVGSGQTYERTAIEKWFETKDTDPNTNVILTEGGKKLVPNFVVKGIIGQMLQPTI